jgi:hypothetical protein
VLITKTFNSTNQVQYDPRYERLLYFTDFETVEIVPLPHKNTVVPFGYNRLKGKVFGKEEVIAACVVKPKPDPGVHPSQMYKRLLGIT